MRTGWRVYGFFAVFVLLNIAANYVHAVTPAFFQELVLPDYMFGVALALMYLLLLRHPRPAPPAAPGGFIIDGDFLAGSQGLK